MSTLGMILLIILVLVLLGSVPYGRTRGWGYAPSGGIGVVLIIILILVLLGVF